MSLSEALKEPERRTRVVDDCVSLVDAEGSMVQAARALGISFGDRERTTSPFETLAPCTEQHVVV